MHEKKSILFVITTMGRAGAERALLEMMRQLSPEQHELFLYVLIPRGELFAELPPYVTVLNRRPDCRSVLSPGGKLAIAVTLSRSALWAGGFVKLLRRFLQGLRSGENPGIEKLLRRMLADGTPPLKREFDLAVAYLEGSATWYVAEKIRARRKVAFVHTDYILAGYLRSLDGDSYQAFDRVFSVSGDVRRQFLKVHPECTEKTSVFLNIVDREGIRAKAQLPGGFSDGYTGLRILTVGRLYHVKGYDVAIEAAALLRAWGYSFRWYALGEGEERARLTKLIRRKGLMEVFFLSGATDNPYPYFFQADIYVCASRYEGKSIVIEEAQALGKPVIATGCSGVNEQIRDGVDGIVAGDGAESLARAIAALIDDPQLRSRFGRAAYEREDADESGLREFLSLLEGAVYAEQV